jgi:membrane protein DedA with SNARE-associated domain
LTQFIATYGVWLVAAFIALETVGLPLPAEAALMAAAIFAAQTHGFDIRSLIAAGIGAAIVGNIAGYWIGQKYGHALLLRYGGRVGLTQERLRIGQWLFTRYGGSFVFAARFLPFVRNLAALLAGVNCMPAPRFYAASSGAAVLWVAGYALGSYAFGQAFADLASPAAIVLGLVAVAIIVAVPILILRYEKGLLEKSDQGLPRTPLHPPA